MPLAALHGISRETRLVAHGVRLALREIAALTEPEAQEPPRTAAHLSRRWGSRWAWFFSGAGML